METFFVYITKSGLVLSFFYIVYILFLRKETFLEFNRHFLNIGLLLSIIVPFIKYKTQYKIVSSSYLIPESLNINANTIPNTDSFIFNISNNLHFIYIAVSIIFIVRLILSIYSFYEYIRYLDKQKMDGYIFIKSNDTNSPFSFMNYIVYNPNLFTTSELGEVLNHEKEHSRQKHSYDIILVEIYRAIYWLNPFAWLYKKVIVQNLEFLADSNAIISSKDKIFYQNTMLKLSVSPSRIKLANNFYDSLIKKRISIINTNKSKRINLMKSLLVIPAIFVFIFQINSELVAQNIEESLTRYTVTEIETSLSKTIDELIETTPKYSGDDTPLYVLDRMLTNRSAIFGIPVDKVKRVSLVKKEVIQGRYGKGAVALGVIEIDTNYGTRKVVEGHELPESQRPLTIVNGKEYKGAPDAIAPDDIKSVNVIENPEEAKKKYGDKGKNGVIEITLKDGVKF